MSEKPSIRWGIITTGMISQWFVEDVMLDRPDAPVNHIIQAIGTSSMQKAKDFVRDYCPTQSPALYDSYQGCYNDSDVDVIYIGTPHGFHKQNCLDAIAAGKNILCEKAFTINAREAKEVFEAARKEGVYVHEAMWLRHRPLVTELRKVLYEEKAIGDVFRTFSDFSMHVDVANLPGTSRYKDLKLGAGTLLDMGIYALTWGILTLDPGTPKDSEVPKIVSTQTKLDGVDVTTSILLLYESSGRQGIITATTNANVDPDVVARIQGTDVYVEVNGPVPPFAYSFTVFPKADRKKQSFAVERAQGKKYDFPKIGRGFIYEADNTALDVLAGKKESDVMPWAETIRVMEYMDKSIFGSETKGSDEVLTWLGQKVFYAKNRPGRFEKAEVFADDDNGERDARLEVSWEGV